MNETWLPVVGYEDLYAVSDSGRVRRLDTEVRMPPSRRHPDGWVRKQVGKVLSPGPAASGHLTVALCRNGVARSYGVHRIVCEAFHGRPAEGQEACHNNGIPSDNRADNIRWDSRSGNMRDKRLHGTDHQLKKTHCRQGHEYTPENTRVRNGSRFCRRCHADESNTRYHSTKILRPRQKKERCVNGHPLEGNQYSSNGGCKTCARARASR